MKRLVVCCDGTWNRRDRGARWTNVAKTASAVVPHDGPVRQVVYYDEGVGTGGRLDRLVGGATGHGLEANVLDAYRFLVANHEPGDEIYAFGFSRGAYTARSLVGFVRKCGILHRPETARVEAAYRLYRGQLHPDDPEAVAFRTTYAKSTRVRFLGVWDTVGALGIPGGLFRSFNRRRHGFHDVQLSRSVDVACHALAIDERRRAFKPTLWTTTPDPRQLVRQEWFPGVHSNVGGGYAETGLSDIALDWMLGEAATAGLALRPDARSSLAPDPAGVLVNSRHGVWRLLPGGWRRIGDPRVQPQDLHPSAIQRLADAACQYAPRNLQAYLGAGSAPQASSAEAVA